MPLQGRAGARAVNLRGPSVYKRGQSLKLSTKAAVFKRASFLIGGGGAKNVDWNDGPPWLRPCYKAKSINLLTLTTHNQLTAVATMKQIRTENFIAEQKAMSVENLQRQQTIKVKNHG